MTRKSRRLRRSSLFRGVIIVALSLFIGASVYSINASRIAHDSLPMPFGYGMSVVLTGSMEPNIKENDLIIVHKQDSYKVDDVVVYQSRNELIVHRIKEIDEDIIITQGDANNSLDEPISSSVVKGKVICNIPFIGRLVNMLKSPVGIVVVIAAAVLLMELSFRKDKSRDNEDMEKVREEIRRLKEGE